MACNGDPQMVSEVERGTIATVLTITPTRRTNLAVHTKETRWWDETIRLLTVSMHAGKAAMA